MQAVPFPVYPELHEQLNYPAVFVQVALAAQLCALPVHSSSSGERAGEVEQMSMSKRKNSTPLRFFYAEKSKQSKGLASATSQPSNRQKLVLNKDSAHTKACWEIVDRPKNRPALV